MSARAHISKNTYRVQATRAMRADVLWRLGASGAGVRVAILDTGVASRRSDAFRSGRIRERLNFCPGASLDDGMYYVQCTMYTWAISHSLSKVALILVYLHATLFYVFK